MDTAWYRRQIPPVQLLTAFAVGYRIARYGGAVGLLQWLGYVLVSMLVMSLLFWLIMPPENFYVWWSWLIYFSLVFCLATGTLGHEFMEKQVTAQKKAEFLHRFELAVQMFTEHRLKDELAAAASATRAKLPRRLLVPHPQIIKSIMVAGEQPDRMEAEGEKAWSAVSSWWRRIFSRKLT